MKKPAQKQSQEPASPVTIFYSYAHADELFQRELEKHLSSLRRQGIIQELHQREIPAGSYRDTQVSAYMMSASLILLLISPDFLASDYCYSIEMKKALERHVAGEAVVIPIILRPVDWQGESFAELQCLPRNSLSITTASNQDEAFRAIAQEIRSIVENISRGAYPLSQRPAPVRNNSRRNNITNFSPESEDKNRINVLNQVYTEWIARRLEQSLYGKAHITLELHEHPEATENRWSQEVQEEASPIRFTKSYTDILQTYDQSGHQLLILGGPGAGKTTFLLELTRDLLHRTAHDDTHPIPIVLNLVSWFNKRQPLENWLIDQLQEKYFVQSTLARSWVNNNQLLLLLDGLDEVPPRHQAGCISAINTFRQAHSIVPIVVCSRYAEYLQHTTRLLLHTAVIIQPLTEPVIDQYLVETGLNLEAVRMALQEDAALREIATTPLMLDIMVRTYHDCSIEELPLKGSLAERRQQIFATYIQRMLHRRAKKQPSYKPEQVIHSLAWLARSMTQWGQEAFRLELMQPDVLLDPDLLSRYHFIIGLILGCMFALLMVIYSLLINHTSLVLLITIFLGIGGFSVGCLYVSASIEQGNDRRELYDLGVRMGIEQSKLRDEIRLLEIEPAERLTWSWGKGYAQIKRLLSSSLQPFTARFRILTRQHSYLAKGLAIFGLFPYLMLLFLGIFFGIEIIPIALGTLITIIVAGGLSHQAKKRYFPTRSSMAIFQAARTGIIAIVLTFLIVASLGGLILFQYSWLSGKLGDGFLATVAFGPVISHKAIPFSAFFPFLLLLAFMYGMLAGLRHGGMTCIQRIVLRAFLWRAGYAPWDLPRFLDYATEHILLRKAGNGSYAFFHQLLLEYFVSLDEDSPDTAENLDTLARLYCEQGQFEKAISLLQQALRIAEQTLEADDPNLAVMLNNLAWCYSSSGQYEEALPLQQRALSLREHVLGPSHLDTANIIYKLAELYCNLERFGEAEPLLQRLMAIYTNKGLSISWTMVLSQALYLQLLKKTGRDLEATQLETQIQETQKQLATDLTARYSQKAKREEFYRRIENNIEADALKLSKFFQKGKKLLKRD